MSRPVRICFIGWANHVHLERWAGYFPSIGYDVSVISVGGKGSYPAGVKQYSLGFIRAAYYRLRLVHLRILLLLIRPDIVHVHYAGLLTSIGDIWQGPLVVTAWGSDIYRAELLAKRDQTLMRQGLAKAACITCDSNDLQRALVRFCPETEHQISLIQWGVDTSLFHPGPCSGKLLAGNQIIGRPVILSPRNFFPLYRLETIVKAFALVKLEHADAALLMKRYGSDPVYSGTIENLIQDLGLSESVFIIDKADYKEMVDFYRSGKITVSVPESDGTPMSVLEAMSCASVPVVSDLPSLREWVSDYENGRLVPVGDERGLATAIIELLNSPVLCDEIVARNLKVVEARASQHVNMQKMDKIYRKLAQSGTI